MRKFGAGPRGIGYFVLAVGAAWALHWTMACLGPHGGFTSRAARFSWFGPTLTVGHSIGFFWAHPGQTITVDYDCEMEPGNYVDVFVGKYEPAFRLYQRYHMEMVTIRSSGRGRFSHPVTLGGLQAVEKSASSYLTGRLTVRWSVE